MNIAISTEGCHALACMLDRSTLEDNARQLRLAAKELDERAMELDHADGFRCFELSYCCRSFADKFEAISEYENLDTIIRPGSEVSHG